MARKLIQRAIRSGAVLLLALGSGVGANEGDEADAFFENEVRPLFHERCSGCHGPKKSESGLRLDRRDHALRGGDSGPALVPGQPDESLLIQAVRREGKRKMPPRKPLTAREVAILERWVKIGAPWPRRIPPGPAEPAAAGTPTGAKIRSGPITDAERAHWSYQPVVRREPPAVDPGERRDASPCWARTPVDRFIQRALQERDLPLAEPASKHELLRRATFGLTGLPPTPVEIEAFIADDSEGAFERVVERLLRSPHYGERWGRHWLDVARYADTAGETADYPVPLAWKYRNWVIDAFNADKPYDEFIHEQIAGDIIARSAPRERYEDLVTATGFLAISRRFGFGIIEFQYLTIQDTIDTTGQAVLGLTLGCARCHDHKYDPVTTADYYGWYGIFASSQYALSGDEKTKKERNFVPAVPPAEAKIRRAAFDKELADLNAEIKRLEAEKKPLEERVRVLAGADPGFEMQGIDARPGQPWSSHQSARIVASAQSPYTNVYPAGTRGIAFPSNNDNNHFGQRVVPPRTVASCRALAFNLDFRNVAQAAGGKGAYRFYLGRGPGSSPAVELGASATTFWIKDGSAYKPLRKLELGRWYNVQLVLDLKTKTYSGAVGAPGDVTTFENRAFTTGWEGTIDQFFVDKFGPVPGVSPAREFDNLAVRAAQDASGTFLPVERSIGGEKITVAIDRWSALARERLDAVSRRLGEITPRRDAIRKSGPYELVYGVVESPAPKNASIHLRGNPKTPGGETPRRDLEILGGTLIRDPRTSSGRLDLARWLTRRDNPLTARVMVNRIWRYHFGRGLVDTPNDFGVRGERPSHPELLDWLADEFMASGWSIKHMHRLILRSAVYQLSSKVGEEMLSQAVELERTRLFGRFPRRRLEAEAIRDAMLAVGGRLDRTPGKGHPFPPSSRWGFSQHGPFYAVYPTERRSVYLMTQRLKRHPFLALFDGADTNSSTAKRTETTTPTQALYLLNSDFVHQAGMAFAERMLQHSKDARERVRFGFLSALGRPPSDNEVDASVDFVQRYREGVAGAGGSGEALGRESWSAFARTLLIRNDSLFVE